MLDPASSVEMVKVLEEDPMVGGVGGDVQVSTTVFRLTEGFQQLFGLQQIFPPGIALNILWYHYRGSYDTSTFLSGEQKLLFLDENTVQF